MPNEVIDFIAGTFTAGGQTSDRIPIKGRFSLSLSGFGTATIQIRRTFNSGSSFFVIKEYTADVSEIGLEPGSDVEYDLRADSVGAGTITFRLSQGDLSV